MEPNNVQVMNSGLSCLDKFTLAVRKFHEAKIFHHCEHNFVGFFQERLILESGTSEVQALLG